jgi:hypothetical protein
MTDAAAAPTPAPGKPGLMDCAEIYYAPSAVFERRRQGKFGLPLLVYVIAMIVIFFATRDLMKPLMDAQMNRSMAAAAAKNPNMTPEQMEAGRAFGAKIAPVGVVVGSAVVPLVVGLIIWLVAKFAGAGLSIGQGMVVGVFSMFPVIVEYIVNAVQMAVLDTSGVTTNYDLSVGPARFMHEASHLVQAVVGDIDVFTIWMAFLVYLGIKVIGRTSSQTAATAAIVLWLLGALPAVFGALRAG